MDRARSLIDQADEIARARGWKRSSVSKRVLNDTYALDEIEAGRRRVWPETLDKIEAGLARLRGEDAHRPAA